MTKFEVLIAPSVISDCDGYRHLSEIYGMVLSQENPEVEIVFNQCWEFQSNLAAVLGSILTDLKDRGYNISLTLPIAMKVRRSLSRCKFLKAFEIISNSLERENYIEYHIFSPEESNDFKIYIEEQLMRKQKFPAHSQMAGKLIQESILEIFVNAVEHGKCDRIFCCGEYISGDDPPVLNMSIVDRGHTIMRTVNEFMARKSLPRRFSSCEAIHWALEEGHTTKDFPGGLGLTRLRNFVDANRGGMQIVSDRGMVEYSGGDMIDYDMVTPFVGTIVTMKFNFDDNQNYYIAKEEEELFNLDNLL